MKRLKLKRESIRVLADLTDVIGGYIEEKPTNNCSGTCHYCTIPWPPPLR